MAAILSRPQCVNWSINLLKHNKRLWGGTTLFTKCGCAPVNYVILQTTSIPKATLLWRHDKTKTLQVALGDHGWRSSVVFSHSYLEIIGKKNKNLCPLYMFSFFIFFSQSLTFVLLAQLGGLGIGRSISIGSPSLSEQSLSSAFATIGVLLILSCSWSGTWDMRYLQTGMVGIQYYCGYRNLSTRSITIPRTAEGQTWYCDAKCG